MSINVIEQRRRLNTLDIASHPDQGSRKSEPFSVVKTFNLSFDVVTKLACLPLKNIDLEWINNQKNQQSQTQRRTPEDDQNWANLALSIEEAAKNSSLLPPAQEDLIHAVDATVLKKLQKENMEKTKRDNNWTEYAKLSVEFAALFPEEIGYIDRSQTTRDGIIGIIERRMEYLKENHDFASSVLDNIGNFELLFPGQGEALINKHKDFWEYMCTNHDTSYYFGELIFYSRLKLAAPTFFAARVSQETIDGLLGENIIQEIDHHDRYDNTTLLQDTVYYASVLSVDTISLTSKGVVFNKSDTLANDLPLPERKTF